MWNDVLFELGTEELPSLAVKTLGQALFVHLTEALLARGLIDEMPKTECLATPRRLAIQLRVKSQEPEQQIERQGPAYSVGINEQGEPTPALLGFARSCGTTLEGLSIKETEKGKWWGYRQTVQGKSLKELLPELILKAVDALPIQKMMRWGEGIYTFARPVHWSVLLVEDEVIEMSILGCRTGRLSYGHRFHHPHSVEISHANQYVESLKKAHVIVDFEVRRTLAQNEIIKAASAIGGVASIDEALLDEVASIVEWPVALPIPFDVEFLENVPPEALIAAMQVHQKCFPVYAKSELMPYCITVSNIASLSPAHVVQGNARVMRARLSDAAFFYAQDKQMSLSSAIEKTKHVVFQEKLGTLYDKSLRLAGLMEFFVPIFELNLQDARRSALLSKVDLMTSMVNEFPELEGLMGYYYALYAKESSAVAFALKEQYWPRFSGDVLPNTLLGLALSLADRLDTLVGAFGIGLRPTSTKDPFKLRRHAVAVIRILKASRTKTPLSLFALLKQAASAYSQLDISEETLRALHGFILDRLPSVFQNTGSGLIQAVLVQQQDSLYDFEQRLKALGKFFEREESQALSAAAKRVERLLQTTDFKNDDMLVDKRHLILDAEKALLVKIELLERQVLDYLSLSVMPTVDEYNRVLTSLADCRQTVDDFFEQVLVMVEDDVVKNNRLTLLARLHRLFQCVGDISKVS